MGRELKIIHCWGGLLVQSKALAPALSHHHATTAALHHPPSSSSISLPWTLYTESCECIKWEMYLCTTTTTTKRHSSEGNWQGEKWSDIHAMPLHLYTSHHHHRSRRRCVLSQSCVCGYYRRNTHFLLWKVDLKIHILKHVTLLG